MLAAHIPAPSYTEGHPLQALVTNLDASPYLGRLALCRVFEGTIRQGQQIAWCRADGSIERTKVTELYVCEALDRVSAEEAGPGDDRGLVLVEDAQPDLLDLVAQRRGALELELLGRRAHLGLHPRDELLDLLRVELGEPRVARLALRRVHDRALGDGPELVVEVADALDDRRRLDAVLVVVGRSGSSRRRSVSSIATRIDSVIRSAYITTSPPMLRAARPIIWMSDHADRRKPSLSASRIATRVTSGRSMPSRSRLMPTTTSNTPRRRSRRIATRSSVSTSEWRYWTLTPSSRR